MTTGIFIQRILLQVALSVTIVIATSQASAAVYQYSIPVGLRTAYLWVPPRCREVRGVVIAMANLTERQWLEDPVVQQAATDECLGMLWLGPGDESLVNAEMKAGSGEALVRMLHDFAAKSGFPELEFAPVIAMGHSAHGEFAWRFAEWSPERTIAAIPIKTYPLPADIKLQGVPMLYAVGETTEWPQYRDSSRPGDRDFFWPVIRSTALALRAEDPQALLGVAVDAGGGHFDWSKGLAELVAANIRAVCRLRLPPHASKTGPVKLRPLRADQGWLTDTGACSRTYSRRLPTRSTAVIAPKLTGFRIVRPQ
jgi:pimeloyl-ACP methyl ester carboxylesterase